MAQHWIINRPERVSRWRKSFWGAVTVVAWVAFVWLLVPLVTLALWAFGLTTAYSSFAAVLPSIEPELLAMLALAALVMATSLLAWAELNRWRFTGKERRAHVPPVTPEQIAADYGVPDAVMDALQAGRSIRVEVNEAGWPSTVRTHHVERRRGGPEQL